MNSKETLIKKYPNRRLYDTSTSTYITLEEVRQVIVSGENVRVVDAKTNDDLTRATLMQIMLEEEAEGAPIFNVQMLSSIIRAYGTAQQSVMGPFLEANLKNFVNVQEQLQSQVSKALSPAAATAAWQELLDKNSQVFTDVSSAQTQAVRQMFDQMQAMGGIWGKTKK